MNLERHPAGDSIGYLRQGAELIRRLDDDQFTRNPGGNFRGGVGSQFRHCIDIYGCLLRGLDGSDRIDYAARGRDAKMETDRIGAAEELDRLADRLIALDALELDRPVAVRTERPVPGVPEWCFSSVHRELQFLVSHTVHHFALIAALLGRFGFQLDSDLADFGVAPSTLAHWKETDRLTG